MGSKAKQSRRPHGSDGLLRPEFPKNKISKIRKNNQVQVVSGPYARRPTASLRARRRALAPPPGAIPAAGRAALRESPQRSVQRRHPLAEARRIRSPQAVKLLAGLGGGEEGGGWSGAQRD